MPLLAAAIALILLGLLLPRAWYDALPWGAELPPQPIKGVTLLQFALVLEGVALLWLSFRPRVLRTLEAKELPGLHLPRADDAVARGRACWVLGAITALALALRMHHINSDLWLDEIAPVMGYGPLSWLDVVASYQRSNNHLLNTLLVKGAVVLFGEREWAIRLPAVLFGTATIPALYWAARMAVERRVALGAALLLALSYHHIFFSQNARGYAAYMLFAVLASGLLVSGLRRDRARDWALYVLVLYLGFASQLITTFVALAHGLVGLIAAGVVRARGDSPLPLLGRLAGVFGVAALLVFQLYATIIPQAYVVAQTTYGSAASGFSPFSLDFLRELIRGLSAGFGTGLLLGAVPFLLLGVAGFLVLLRRQWALATALLLPEVVTAAFLFARGYTFSPRFFLLGLPLAVVCAVQGLWTVSAYVTRRTANFERLGPRLATGAVLLLGVISVIALRPYYRLPKQDYRGAIHYVESTRRPGDVVVVFGIAEKGIRFYSARLGVPADAGYLYLRDEAALDTILAVAPRRRVLVVATFMRELRINYPMLAASLRNDWPRPRRFDGTVGDGAVLVFDRTPEPKRP